MIAISEGPDVEHEVAEAPTAGWSPAAAAFLAWREGDESALEELVRGLSPTLWQIARACGLDRASAEDVVQTTWLALVNHADGVATPQAVTGWLCTTARRESWRVSKKARRERATEDDSLAPALPDSPSPEAEIVLSDDKERLRRALGRISERCQRLLRILAAGPRPDYAEVSRTMDMPVGSIGPTRGRCLDRLREALLSEGGAA